MDAVVGTIRLGKEFQIPPLQSNAIAPPPGPWADILMACNFDKAKKGGHIQGSFLPQLLKKTPLRELCVRVKSPLDGPGYYSQLNDRIVNIEAAVGQIVGVEQPSPCSFCHNGHGKFLQCVTNFETGMAACMACYHGNKASRCSFNADRPDQERPTQSHKRRLSDVLSTHRGTLRIAPTRHDWLVLLLSEKKILEAKLRDIEDALQKVSIQCEDALQASSQAVNRQQNCRQPNPSLKDIQIQTLSMLAMTNNMLAIDEVEAAKREFQAAESRILELIQKLADMLRAST